MFRGPTKRSGIVIFFCLFVLNCGTTDFSIDCQSIFYICSMLPGDWYSSLRGEAPSSSTLTGKAPSSSFSCRRSLKEWVPISSSSLAKALMRSFQLKCSKIRMNWGEKLAENRGRYCDVKSTKFLFYKKEILAVYCDCNSLQFSLEKWLKIVRNLI